MTGVIKTVVCVILSMHIKEPFMVDPLNYFLFQPVLHDWCNCLWDDAYKNTIAANWKE